MRWRGVVGFGTDKEDRACRTAFTVSTHKHYTTHYNEGTVKQPHPTQNHITSDSAWLVEFSKIGHPFQSSFRDIPKYLVKCLEWPNWKRKATVSCLPMPYCNPRWQAVTILCQASHAVSAWWRCKIAQCVCMWERKRKKMKALWPHSGLS